ncbi:MAG TPA: GNAT family N-acetyltransferase [Bryobacteraceae bacterium]|nr:GNAT family N-acetyltransferase [Bryobacteraceae bacterium]
MNNTLAPTQSFRVELSGGVAEWRTLEWDSEQFGMPAARLDRLTVPGSYNIQRSHKRKLLSLVLGQCLEQGVRHLTARVDTADLASIHALEEIGFELVDGIQSFRLTLSQAHDTEPSGARLFNPADLPQVMAIGRTAFVFDRFHSDPQLAPSLADRVNENWTRNCCLGISADVALVAEDEGRIASYVACRTDRESRCGSIILIATAGWARGRGMARRASLAALHWFRRQGMEYVEVGTQFRNIPAAGLFQNLGFRLFQTALTFRRTL